jgi:hypothetical protein
MIRSKNALRHGNCFAQQRLGFFEAIYPHKGVRVVVGCNESYDDKTLLAIAAEVGNLESMRVMMEMGADPRADNGTALHQAAFFGQTAAVELLLDAGVPVNVNAGRGRSETPLTWAVLYSHYDTALLLLRRGAAFAGPLSQVREGGYHREPGYERVDKLLADVEAAGSWAGYAREPRKKMLVLAKLCEKGRATPPRRDRVFGALFAGTGGGSRRKGAAVVIPREVFWKVFEFWPCSH